MTSRRSKAHKPVKQDRPNWSWGKHGAYTASADAAAYVAQCRQREIEQQRKREEWALELLEAGWTIFKSVKSAYNPVIARGGSHKSIRQETVTRLEQRGVIVPLGKLAYRLRGAVEAPVPPLSLAEQLRMGVETVIERKAA